jgi:hypothetical protein
MPAKHLDLSTFDGQLLDGLEFCQRVYDLFDQTRRQPDGIAKLRLRPTKDEKRLLEELIPLARFLQARYREGRRIKVRWFSGSQPYDAILWSSGGLVTHGMARRRQFVEVTTSVHPNDYLDRQLFHTKGISWGVKRIWRNKKTKEIVSEPYVYRNDERSVDLANQILERLKDKSAKKYPAGTVLIVNCDSDGLLLEDEWDQAIRRVNDAQQHLAFREVFLVETGRGYSATLYGKRIPIRRRKTRKPAA